MAPPDLPGFYWDPERRKYFAIVSNAHGTASSQYTVDGVKKRRLAEAEAQLLERKKQSLKRRIRRSESLTDPLTGGLLRRESGWSGEYGEHGSLTREGEALDCWTRGLRDKGCVYLTSFAPTDDGSEVSSNLPLFCVQNKEVDEKCGYVYACPDEASVLGAYLVSAERDDRLINLRNRHQYADDPVWKRLPYNAMSIEDRGLMLPQLSSMAYHEPTDRVFMVSREPQRSVGVSFFRPGSFRPDSDSDNTNDYRTYRVTNDTGIMDGWQTMAIRVPGGGYGWANRVVAAPKTSELACAVGMNDGLIVMNATREVMKGPAPPKRQTKKTSDMLSSELLDVDFVGADQPSLILGAGRRGRLWLCDLRAAGSQWTGITHRSGAAHVRSAGNGTVLVAGLDDWMALYDLRCLRALELQSPRSQPLFTFQGYKNKERNDLGLATLTQAPYGVVATAHDDGKVALYSLRSGRRLTSAVLDNLTTSQPIKCMEWSTMPGDENPSLFIGRGGRVEKYSFGVVEGKEE